MDDSAPSPTPPSPSPSPSTSTTPADAAKARREARKARILSKGSDRLAKLTKQARGDEAEMLYPSGTPTPASPAPQPNASAAPPAADDDADDPEEVDISHQARLDQEMERSLEMFRQRRQGGSAGAGDDAAVGDAAAAPQDPMQAMMAALMGGGGADGGAAPAGMPDLSQLFAAMGQGQTQGGGADGTQPPPDMSGLFGPQGKVERSPRTLFDRLFSLAHITMFLLLGYFAISSTLSTSPALDNIARGGRGSGSGGGRLAGEFEASENLVRVGEAVHERHRAFKWASLAYRKPTMADADYFRVDGSWLGISGSVPIFWLFITLEVVLQSSRILLFARKPPPSSLLFSLASQLPFPTLQWTLRILARYASILSSFLDDVAVLVFAVGCGILWCASRVASEARAGAGGMDQAQYAALGAKA